MEENCFNNLNISPLLKSEVSLATWHPSKEKELEQQEVQDLLKTLDPMNHEELQERMNSKRSRDNCPKTSTKRTKKKYKY
ncbi:hypothetical protein JTE90_016065 [Oedothorax gibbosus]|uniref:Uncharacterized protein n=1 Tax=Oedothorax gibbosus TaxID=931172 RepID=A0AAV6U126_9ARAC|nr:hypothetical protein JTE90_016065 [Oedothorax gibbosus]